MWASSVNQDRLQRLDTASQSQWHRMTTLPGESVADPSHLRPTGEAEDLDSSRDFAGTYGESDVGGFSEQAAAEEFEALRRDLTQLSRSRSKDTQHSLRRTSTAKSGLRRAKSNRSRVSLDPPSSRVAQTPSVEASNARLEENEKQAEEEPESPVHTIDIEDEAGGEKEEDEEDEQEELDLGHFMREGHFEKRSDGVSHKKVGVIFRDLTVKGTGSTSTFVRTLPDAVLGTFGPDLYNILCRFVPSLAKKQQSLRTLINSFSGCVRDGEMLLVLGRPGSGCSTFLKAIANKRESYAEVTGEVSYGGISAEKQKKMYRGEVNYNYEDDTHFANLNVWQTFIFALINKTRKRSQDEIPIIANALMKVFGISHTKYTLVGDEYTRGVSGGERKRVSIAETLASKATVIAWDNSTRGLDASTALDYARSLRIMTDISNRTTLVTLYQAGEGIYELMDKVLVIDQGREIYYGPAKEAKQYFIDLGFDCPDRQTTSDFLTACTDPVERRFRSGCEDSTPKTPEELERAFRESSSQRKVLEDVDNYERYLKESNFDDAKRFENAVQEDKSKRVPKKSPYTISYPRQVMACTKRELWLLLGDTTTLYTKVFIIISNGLIVGSLFYGQPLTTEGAFSRGGTLFFSILFLGWLQLSELMKAVSGRAVVARQKEYAFYRPSAVSLGRVVMDLPVIFVQVILFGVIMYFMTGLDLEPGKFFVYMLFVYITTITLTALYRMLASLSPEIDTAVRFSGVALNFLLIYTGYVIPKTQLLKNYIWFGWILWINPVGYAFEAVLANEFVHRNMTCATDMLIPQGPGAVAAHQGCLLAGAEVNAHDVPGIWYIKQNFNYAWYHLWRNLGVLIAFIVLYILVTVLATEYISFGSAGGGAIIFKKTKKAKRQVQSSAAPADEERAAGSSGDSNTSANKDATLDDSPPDEEAEDEALEQITKSDSIFTWRNVNYTVPYLGGERQLLHEVNGYAKPGKMVALMGASGAGKTTLLNTLSQRQVMGVVEGEMLVDGRALGASFNRNTGFCLQGDLHDGTATVREALEFSAILRQDSSVPRQEKIAYVDRIIDLLELNDLQDALIMSLGVEQRKRVTIGVELAAKPSLLLFLDEPTSGLDSQGAYSIVRFLKKLARAGQAIVCTIHQPSSVLIQQFDMILALNPGGNTFYFGPVGENGKSVIDYFAARGTQCPPEKNVAEFILETAARPGKREDGSRINWNDEWKKSAEAQGVIDEVEGLKRTQSESTTAQKKSKDQEKEFAASTMLQTTELLKRTFRQYWRDPSYLYGKLFVAVIIGIFNGFTFYQLGYSVQDMQNRMFTSFLILTVPPTVVNAVVPKFFQNMALWQARELPSRIYGWIPFCTAQVVAEIPPAVVSAVLYWAIWYWPTGLPTESSVSGYVFLMVMLFFLFQASWGQWICAFAPSFTVISNVLPFFFVMFSLFNGVVRPYSYLPVFWRYWMYWINPSTYWIGGVLAATLDDIPVRCTEDETARFTPPSGMTCQQYAGDFIKQAGGYLLKPHSTTVCEYCEYTVGNDYLSTLNIKADEKWRDMGIFMIFVCTNWMLVYFFIYTVRIKGWSFGMGYLFGGLGKLAGFVKKPFVRLFGKRKD